LKIDTVGTSYSKKADAIEQKTDSVKNTHKIIDNKKVITIKSDEKTQSTPGASNGKCYHNGFKWWLANDIIQYACDISNSDIDFILTMNAENWSRDYKKQSNVIQKNWKREPSFWMCQVHYMYHKKTIYENLPFNRIMESKYLTDWKYQIDTCYRLYKQWVAMYGYNHRYRVLRWLIEINWKMY